MRLSNQKDKEPQADNEYRENQPLQEMRPC